MAIYEDEIKDPQQVLKLVREFIDQHEITVPETIYQTDEIIQSAYELIEKLCEAAGYAVDEYADEDEPFDDDDDY